MLVTESFTFRSILMISNAACHEATYSDVDAIDFDCSGLDAILGTSCSDGDDL